MLTQLLTMTTTHKFPSLSDKHPVDGDMKVLVDDDVEVLLDAGDVLAGDEGGEGRLVVDQLARVGGGPILHERKVCEKVYK